MIRHAATLVAVFLFHAGSVFAQVATQPTVETFDRVGDSLPGGWRVIEGNWRVADRCACRRFAPAGSVHCVRGVGVAEL